MTLFPDAEPAKAGNAACFEVVKSAHISYIYAL